MGLPILLNIASLHRIRVQVVKKWTLGMLAFFGNHLTVGMCGWRPISRMYIKCAA